MSLYSQWEETTYPSLFESVKERFGKERPKTMRVEILKDIQVKDDPVFLIHDLLSEEECKALIEASEQAGYEKAADYCYMYRNRMNDRFMSDDDAFSSLLWPSVSSFLPTWTFAKSRGFPHPHSLNPRWRYCKYNKNHYFGAHVDGSWQPTPNERSLLTFMLYLNGPPEHVGGSTNFINQSTGKKTAGIEPKAGLAIVFPQENVDYFHEGEALLSGKKYILRSDILFSTKPSS